MNYRKSETKAASRAQFRGLWIAITTPFTPDGALDEAGLRRNMRPSSTPAYRGRVMHRRHGRVLGVTKDERKRVVEIMVEEARGKCKVIAHTAHQSVHETVGLTQHAEAAGVDFATALSALIQLRICTSRIVPMTLPLAGS